MLLSNRKKSDKISISIEIASYSVCKTLQTMKTMVHKTKPTTSMEYANKLAANALATGPAADRLVAGSKDFLAEINDQPVASVIPKSFLKSNGESLLIDQAVG